MESFVNIADAVGYVCGLRIDAVSNPAVISLKLKRRLSHCGEFELCLCDLAGIAECYAYQSNAMLHYLRDSVLIDVEYGICLVYFNDCCDYERVYRENQVVFTKLPLDIDPCSIRIHVRNPPSIEICCNEVLVNVLVEVEYTRFD